MLVALTVLLAQTSLTLTCSLVGLLAQTLIGQMVLLALTLQLKLGLLEQIELAPTGLLERKLLPIIVLLGSKIIVLTYLLKLTLLPQMGLPELNRTALTVYSDGHFYRK